MAKTKTASIKKGTSGELVHAQQFEKEVKRWTKAVKKQKPIRRQTKTTPISHPRLHRRLRRFGSGLPRHQQVRPTHRIRKVLGWMMRWIAAPLVGIALVTLAIIYGFGTRDRVSLMIASAFRLPAGAVNGRMIPLDDWIIRSESIEQHYGRQPNTAGLQSLMQPQVRSLTFDRLVDEALLQTMADRYAIYPTDEDVARTKDALAAQVGSQAMLDQQVWDMYNWDEETLIRLIVRPQTLEQQVARAIILDEALNGKIRVAANQAVDAIRGGTSDATGVAETLQQQGIAAIAQDTGYLRRDQLDPIVASALWREAVGAVLDPIPNLTSYSVWVVTEQLRDDAGNLTYIRAQELVIPGITVQQILEQERPQARIWRFVRW